MNYFIPANFTDAGKLMGMFSIRNAIEAVVISIPIIWACFTFLPFDLTTNIIITMVFVIPTGGFALIGINDDCLTRFVATWWRWRRGREIITFRGTPNKKKRRNEEWI